MDGSRKGRANTNIVLGRRRTAGFSTHCGCLATPVSRPLDQSRAESVEKFSNSVRAPAGGPREGGMGGPPQSAQNRVPASFLHVIRYVNLRKGRFQMYHGNQWSIAYAGNTFRFCVYSPRKRPR